MNCYIIRLYLQVFLWKHSNRCSMACSTQHRDLAYHPFSSVQLTDERNLLLSLTDILDPAVDHPISLGWLSYLLSTRMRVLAKTSRRLQMGYILFRQKVEICLDNAWAVAQISYHSGNFCSSSKTLLYLIPANSKVRELHIVLVAVWEKTMARMHGYLSPQMSALFYDWKGLHRRAKLLLPRPQAASYAITPNSRHLTPCLDAFWTWRIQTQGPKACTDKWTTAK